MTPDALRNVLDVSFDIKINHQSHFSWQVFGRFISIMRFICSWRAQYLVKLDCHFFLTGAALPANLGDSRSAKCCFFHAKCGSKMRREGSPKQRVRDDDFLVGLSLEYLRMIFVLAEAVQRFSAEILSSKFVWQAQYLVKLEGDSCCSAHCTGHFM